MESTLNTKDILGYIEKLNFNNKGGSTRQAC